MKTNAKTVVIFSHPNHELAIFGLLKRMRPYLIFLTDGGGKKRIDETRSGLGRLGLAENAIFLNHTEPSFYDAILRMDSGFFAGVAGEVRDLINLSKPDQVLTDAVEFYNPVHDMSLAIVASVFDAWDRLYEVPLLYQKPGVSETYGVQTAPPSRADRFEFELSSEETEAKRSALEENYSILKNTLGPVLLGAPEALRKETILCFQSPLRGPGPDVVLRYDRRGKERQAAGEVKDAIRHEIHFMSVVSKLIGIAEA